MIIIVVLDLLRRFWPPLAVGLGAIAFSGLRQTAADLTWDKLILGAITLLIAVLTLRKDSSAQTIASLKETIEALRTENQEREKQLAEKQAVHSESLEDRISETQTKILDALQATARENRQRIGRIEVQVEELCGSLEKVARVAHSAHEIALQAVAYRNGAIEDLLDLVEGLDYPPEKRPLIRELRALLKEGPDAPPDRG